MLPSVGIQEGRYQLKSESQRSNPFLTRCPPEDFDFFESFGQVTFLPLFYTSRLLHSLSLAASITARQWPFQLCVRERGLP